MSLSEAYNAWLYRRKANTLTAVLSDQDLTGRTVLDLGSGTGFFVRWYASRGAVVTGVDITTISVENLRRDFPSGRFVQADIGGEELALGAEDGFDVINVWDVLYHIVDDDRFERALRNAARCGRPGTRLIVSDVLAAAEPLVPAAHVKFRPLSAYQRVLPALGFQLRTLTPLYFLLNDVRQPDNEHRVAEYFERDEQRRLISSTNLSAGCWVREG
jgi:SAM-dependent methyltransferase